MLAREPVSREKTRLAFVCVVIQLFLIIIIIIIRLNSLKVSGCSDLKRESGLPAGRFNKRSEFNIGTTFTIMEIRKSYPSSRKALYISFEYTIDIIDTLEKH